VSRSWGHHIELSIFGESHGPTIGVVISGLPAGIPMNEEKIAIQMARRAPGAADWSTPRKEADQVKLLSGVYEGFTTGAPLCGMIENTNTKSGDYAGLTIRPRPSHADFTGGIKYKGFNDPRGGGHFSARLTAPLNFAGAVARLYLEARGIRVGGHVCRVGEVTDTAIDYVHPDMDKLTWTAGQGFPAVDEVKAHAMAEAIAAAREEKDSLGGAVEVVATGVPAGLGDPVFAGFESHSASLCYAVPAVKAVEFGAGCTFGSMRGSEANDSFCWEEGQVKTVTNHTGGINGGITNGMPIVARITFRPTPSIGREQDTVDLQEKENVKLEIKGRHDPCIVARALPVVEAALALTIMDFMLEDAGDGIK